MHLQVSMRLLPSIICERPVEGKNTVYGAKVQVRAINSLFRINNSNFA